MNEYYTHRKYLQEELDKLINKKDIKCLEFGSGFGSAPLFNEICKKNTNVFA